MPTTRRAPAETQGARRTTAIVAIVLAVILPPIGLLVGVAALVTATNRGVRDRLAVTAVIVGGALSVMLLGAGAWLIVTRETAPEPPPPAVSASAEVRVEFAVTAAVPLDDALRAAATSVVNDRLTLHRVIFTGIEATGSTLTVVLPADATAASVAAVEDIVSAQLTAGFHPIVAVGDAAGSPRLTAEDAAVFAAVTCAAPHPAEIASFTVACDRNGTAAYLLDRPAVTTDMLAAVDIVEDGPTASVSVTLTTTGAAALTAMATTLVDAAPPEDRFAVTVGDIVLTAQTGTPLVDGRLAIIGGLPSATVAAGNALRAALAGVTLSPVH